MNMYSANKKLYSQFVLDATSLPKSYQIEPGQYEIEIVGEAKYKITPLQAANKKSIANIETFINTLANAACKYTDCYIPLKKYTRFMSLFSDPVTGEKMEDFKF